MIISHKYKCIFISSCKTASTSILNAFSTIADEGDIVCREWPGGKHISALDLRNMLSSEVWENYYKFGMVRNPYDICVSWYEFRRRPEEVESRSTREMSFLEFLESDKHRDFTLRHFFCDKNDQVLVDCLGRYENLQNDLDKICDRIGAPRIKLKHLNKSKKRRYGDYKSYFENIGHDLLPEYVRPDLEIFDYKF